MKILTQDNFIGKGRCRSAYIDPDNEDRCVKIVHYIDRKKCFGESNKENKYFKHLVKKNIDWSMIPKYYGEVNTNKGKGLVFEIVKDYNGEISKSLEYYFETEERMNLIPNPMEKLQNLKNYVIKNKILSRDIRFHNILYKKSSETDGIYVLIDGVSNSEFIPFSQWFSKLNKAKILRRWTQDEGYYKDNFPDNKLFHTLLKQYGYK